MSGEEPDLKLVEQVRRRLAGRARGGTPPAGGGGLV